MAKKDETLTFAGEVVARTENAKTAIVLYGKYRMKVKRLQELFKRKNFKEMHRLTAGEDTAIVDYYDIQEISMRFAILQMCTLLDGSGRFSLVLTKNRKAKLPEFSVLDYASWSKSLKKLLLNHS
jgi:hypothetical protein